MSTIKVEVTRIAEVRTHPNADALELATVGGWQMCVKKGAYRDGDPVVYFEQGTVLPRATAEALGVVNYLAEKTDMQGERVLVVHRIRLRGEPSFGLVITPEPGMEVGQEVAEAYGAEKFFPPIRLRVDDAETDHPRFPAYTDIENMRSYPLVLAEGEEVVVTEKIHGTNCRVGFLREAEEYLPMAGSRALRRKRPENDSLLQAYTYWFPFTLPGVRNLFAALQAAGHSQAVLYGEVYGQGIQAFTYGSRTVGFRAFDLQLDGNYVDYASFAALCEEHGIDRAPLVYQGPFALATVKSLSDGPSLLGGAHGREGVVVKPVVERNDPAIGRVILKYVGDAYLFGKVAEQDTTDV